jgi:LacI family transcriptional regulator
VSPTIRDVAAAAGTSIKTVSRVVNNEPGVAAEMRNRVREVVDALGYAPNISARRLKSGKAETFGLVLPRVESPYAMRLLSCVLREASSQGYSVQVIESNLGLDKAMNVIQRAIQLRQVDGLMVAPPLLDCPELLFDLNARRFPYVIITPNDPQAVSHSVEVTDQAGTAEATRYLLSLGHQRIAYITCGANYRFSRERMAGFSQEMEWGGIPSRHQLIFEGDTTFESGYQIAQNLVELSFVPSAVLAGNDEMAVGVINYLSTKGIGVPQEISVMGFDDMPIAQQVAPQLTTVCQPVDQIVQAAVLMLVRLMQGGQPPETSHVQVHTRLVIRHSCARIADNR